MQSSGSSPTLSRPHPRPKGEGGIWLREFLEVAAEKLPETARAAFLRQIFRWWLQAEGNERLSEEDLRLRRGRLYALLPEGLREYFPWEVPPDLPPPTVERPTYPNAHTPFRQYGFWASRWIDELLKLPESEQSAVGSALVRYLMQAGKNQAVPSEEEAVVEHIYLLSGERLRLPVRGIRLEGGHSPSPERRSFRGRGRGFYRRR